MDVNTVAYGHASSRNTAKRVQLTLFPKGLELEAYLTVVDVIFGIL